MIVNDGSSDHTADICEDYARKHKHIKYIPFPDNRGTNAGRNAAINAATGEWIIFLDSDDYFTDNAIRTIDTTIKEKPNYKHYMFAPNDMASVYEKNYLLNGRNERELSFADFLSGCVAGDFTHVMSSGILRKYPFDESVRIHEGVFFLRFYREARRMLFTNRVVAIRERGRKDSVTRDSIRTSKVFIERILKSKKLNVEWFEEDYKTLGLQWRLCKVYASLIDNSLLLSRYDEAKQYIAKLKACGGSARALQIVGALRLGQAYRLLLKAYLLTKYDILKKSLHI